MGNRRESSNLSICAKKKQSLLWLFLFLYNERFEKGNAKHKNSPADWGGARVRAGERESSPGELSICAKKKQSLLWLFLFYIMRDLLIFFLQIDDLLKIEYNILKEGML